MSLYTAQRYAMSKKNKDEQWTNTKELSPVYVITTKIYNLKIEEWQEIWFGHFKPQPPV